MEHECTQYSLAQTEFIVCSFLTIIQAIIPEEAIITESRSPRRRLRARFQPAGFIGLQAGGEARAGHHSIVPLFPPGRRPYGPEANCERSELSSASAAIDYCVDRFKLGEQLINGIEF